MDKVICDICGTSYPASADQCPICGCEKAAEPIMEEEAAAMAELSTGYKPVKGGRFSNANVRKRNKASQPVPAEEDYDLDEDDDDDVEEEEEEERSNKGLVAVLVLLIIAILALILYLYFNFFAPVNGNKEETENPTVTTAETSLAPETEAPTVPCTNLEVSSTDVLLSAIGDAWLLNVVAEPADTTDAITYVSSDESVATVTSEGCITAVNPGEAVITVSCGNVTVECKVTCTVETEPTTEPTTEPPTEPENWGLNREEFMLYVGDRWPLYEGEVDASQITFKSKNTAVVTVNKNGVVTGVGAGSTLVTAEYNGVSYVCKVYCRVPKTDTGDGGTVG